MPEDLNQYPTPKSQGAEGGRLPCHGSPWRQSGQTTNQMKEAPKGAMYVWVNDHLDYPKHLARHLGREDLMILSPGSVRLETLAGRSIVRGLVIDHATKWTNGIHDAVAYLRGKANDQRNGAADSGPPQQ